MYLALHSTQLSSESAQSLSPRVMLWDKDCWVIDLSVCLAYWQFIAQKKGLTMPMFLREILDSVCEPNYRAVVSQHPWRSILLLYHMGEKDLKGLVDQEDRMGQAIFANISWSTLFSQILKLGEHFQISGFKKFNSATFSKNVNKMRTTIRTLRIRMPSEFSSMDPYDFRRRFGSFVKLAWQWAFPRSSKEEVHLSDFPWLTHCVRPKPRVQRNLDYSMNEWDSLSPLLREDLDRLCLLSSWSPQEKVVCLEWRLTLDDWTLLNVPILFRHPHSLHTELRHQKTALLQAHYNFERKELRQSRGSSSRRDRLAVPARIVSWELVVEESLIPLPQSVGLFHDGLRSPEEGLMDLENRLAVPLVRYEIQESWIPEDAYQLKKCSSQREENGEGPNLLSSLKASGLVRPLYKYRTPRHLESQGPRSSSGWIFLERTMTPWWKSPGPNLYRDYYRRVLSDQRSQWVYKTPQGKWYEHGLFA